MSASTGFVSFEPQALRPLQRLVILAVLWSLALPSTTVASAQETVTSAPAFLKPMYVRQVPIDCSDLTYDPVAHKLYASLPSAFGPSGNSVATIDPITGAIGTPVAVGKEPGGLALSPNGEYLYVILKDGRSIARLNLRTHKVDLTFPTNTGAAVQVRVSPADSERIAVVRQKTTSPGPASVALFDNGVEAAGNPPVERSATSIAFNADGSLLYCLDGWADMTTLARFNINPDGWGKGELNVGLFVGLKQNITFVSGLLYFSGGQVVDSEARVVKGTFYGAGGCVAPDLKSGRVLFFRGQDGRCVVSAYDPQTYRLVGQTTYPKIPGDPASVQICGDVYAFRSGGRIVLIGPSPGLIDACKTRSWSQAFNSIEENVNVNCQDEVGATALMWAAYSGQTSLCTKLLAKGADLRLKDSRDATALHYAVNAGSLDLVQLFLRKGADPNATGRFGTPLKVASDRRRPDIVHLLQQFGAK